MTKGKNKRSFWKGFLYYGGILITIVSILGFGYWIGLFKSRIEHKTEIMEIRQQYNEEITNLKLDYNNRIIELQNELKIIELSKK